MYQHATIKFAGKILFRNKTRFFHFRVKFKGQNQSACFCFVHYLTISYDTNASLTHVNNDRLTSRSQSGRRLSLHVDSDLPPTSIHILTGIRRRNRYFVGRIVEREGFYDCVAVGVKQGHSVSGERPRGCSNRGVPSYGQLTQTKKKHFWKKQQEINLRLLMAVFVL